jgi:excisionase family DNA binding protein
MSETQYLTVAQLAARLNISKGGAYRLTDPHSGALPALRIGRTVRVKLADVEAFEAANTSRQHSRQLVYRQVA